MSPYQRFAVAWATAVVLEMAETWRDPAATLVVMALAVWLVAGGMTARRFFVFLLAPSAWFLVRFPEVANHVNVMLYAHLLMLAAMLAAWPPRRAGVAEESWWALLQPVLRVSLIVVYTMAGFHKLNADYFDPTVSCTRFILARFVALADGLRTPPMTFVAAATLLLAALTVRGAARAGRGGSPRASALGVAVAVAGLFTAVGAAGTARAVLVQMLSVGVVAWELGAVALFVRRCQGPFLFICWAVHAMLALVGFVDFSAMVLALLLTFMPAEYARHLDTPLRLPWIGAVHRLRVYFVVNALLLGGLLGVHFHVAPVLASFRGLSGLVWNLTVLVCFWPMVIRRLAPSERPRWAGVSIGWRGVPAAMAVFPLLLLVHGSSPYLGLRTAGTFSMFSNLRTEGSRSNHLLLGTNPLKRFGYQEDAVRILEIDDDAARIGHQYQPLRGNRLPVVEFRKRVLEWTRAGRTVPMRLEYQGAVHATDDVTRDPRWRVARRDWAMRLMDFRVVQAEGPNACRW